MHFEFNFIMLINFRVNCFVFKCYLINFKIKYFDFVKEIFIILKINYLNFDFIKIIDFKKE